MPSAVFHRLIVERHGFAQRLTNQRVRGLIKSGLQGRMLASTSFF
jgi:hypothetical protein